MPRIIIDIPDSKVGFFMELIKNLGFAKVSKEAASDLSQDEATDIPEAHQKLVMDRFIKVRKDRLLCIGIIIPFGEKPYDIILPGWQSVKFAGDANCK